MEKKSNAGIKRTELKRSDLEQDEEWLGAGVDRIGLVWE